MSPKTFKYIRKSMTGTKNVSGAKWPKNGLKFTKYGFVAKIWP